MSLSQGQTIELRVTPDPFVVTTPAQPLGGNVAANAVPRFTH